jgi:predicted Zn-dependent protease
VKGVHLSESLLSLLGRVEGVGGDFAWDTSAACCRDGGAGMVAITTGAPHLRLVDVAVGEGIS